MSVVLIVVGAAVVAVAVVLLFVNVCLRVLVCSGIVGAKRSVTRAGYRPPAPICLVIIDDLVCTGFNLHFAAYCGMMERWNDGRESCAVLRCCAVVLPPFVSFVYALTEVTENVVLLPECSPKSYEHTII